MLMLALLFAACNNQAKQGQESAQNDSEQKENTSTASYEQEKKKDKSEGDEHTYQITDLKKGMELGGLKIKGVEYKEHDFFNVELKGSITVSGALSYNDFEDGYDFKPERGEAPKFEIVMHDQVYTFIDVFAISNRKDLLHALSAEQKKLLKELKSVPLTLKLSELSVGVKIDKGRLGVAWCKFEEVEKMVMGNNPQQIIIKDYIFNFASNQQDTQALAS